jgi:hypothetical protein
MRGTIGKSQKETWYVILLHTVDSMLCVIISINMCFIKFVAHKINSEMVLSLE